MSLLGCPGGGGGEHSRFYLPTSSLWALGYGAFLCSALCYALLSWCNNKTSPTTVTSFWPLQVIASAYLSAIFLDYHLITSDIIGASMVVAGLVCVVVAKRVQENRVAAASTGSPSSPDPASPPLLGPGSKTINSALTSPTGSPPSSPPASRHTYGTLGSDDEEEEGGAGAPYQRHDLEHKAGARTSTKFD
jgi:hypothetical protein